MTFFQAIRTGFRRYADFSGTASRSEFWWWVLFATLASAMLTAFADAVFGNGDTSLNALWSLAVLLPSLAVTVRRLRDADYSWGHVFWMLLPFVGAIIIAVLAAQPTAQRPMAGPLAHDVSTGARS